MPPQGRPIDADDHRIRDAKIFAENLEELATRTRPGHPVPGVDRIDGPDRSGSVYCVVDRTGTVVNVRIESDWWETLGPGRIAAAIMEALDYARSKASMALMILDRHGHRPDVPPAPDFGSQVAGPAIPLPDPDDPGFDFAAQAKLERAFTILDAAERLGQTRDVAERRIVAGPAGLFRLILAGHAVRGAEVDQHHLGPYDGDRLASDARIALRQVSRGATRTRQSFQEGR